MKRCFKCGEAKPLRDFYPHKRMADGHLNKCKECTKTDVARRYREDPLARAAYEKRRASDPDRKARVIAYQRGARVNHPEKLAARLAVQRAVRRGLMRRLPCEICGKERTEAHHVDYSRPLDVLWLCFKHHREIGHGQRVVAASGGRGDP